MTQRINEQRQMCDKERKKMYERTKKPVQAKTTTRGRRWRFRCPLWPKKTCCYCSHKTTQLSKISWLVAYPVKGGLYVFPQIKSLRILDIGQDKDDAYWIVRVRMLALFNACQIAIIWKKTFSIYVPGNSTSISYSVFSSWEA